MNEKSQNKYACFGVVIDPQKESANPTEELAHFQDILLAGECFVASIIHDKDLTEQGELKQIHLHAFIELPKKHTKKQALTLLSELLDIPTTQISLTPDNNGYLLVQYLTHKNQPNKTKYDFKDIRTNNAKLLQSRYNQKYVNQAERQANLETDLKACLSFVEFLELQGVENAKKYQSVFNQVKKEQKQDLDFINNLLIQHEKFVAEVKDLVKNYSFMDKESNVLADKIKRLIIEYDI